MITRLHDARRSSVSVVKVTIITTLLIVFSILAPAQIATNRNADPLVPLKRQLWFNQQRAYPYTEIPRGAYWRAQVQKQNLIANRNRRLSTMEPEMAAQAGPFSGVTWTPDGPEPVYANGPSGRATSIAVHPTDSNTVYLGTAAGGVWKTMDDGQTWIPLTDSQASLAIGALAIDPNNPNTIYAGTGEPDFAVDSYYGQGLLKSTDAGATWSLIRTPFTSGDTAPSFTSITVQPGNSNVILAGNVSWSAWNGSGLYRSADGGQTWNQVIAPGGYTGVSSVMFDVKNPNIAYAGTGGAFYPTSAATVYMSTDSGQTWTSISGSGTSGVPAPTSVLRTALAESSDGKTLFAAFANSNDTAPGNLYSTTNAGTTWTKLSSPSASDGLDWYRNGIAVDPANPLVIYATGVNLYRSMDGGQTWGTICGCGNYADQHAMVFSPDGRKMYLADDGGIYLTTMPAATNPSFISLNNTLNTNTFYPGFSLIPGQANSALAGSQDHGLNLYAGSLAWTLGDDDRFCGDGGAAYIDPQGKYAYAHCWGGAANWISNATGVSNPADWSPAQTGINTSDRIPWVPDIKGDQKNVAIVYTATNYLYQSTNNAGSWTSISPDLTQGKSVINTIGVSPTDSNTIYAGAGDGTLSVTTNALAGTAATWKTLSGLPNRSISKVLVQPDSAADVYVTVSGFDTGHVFHSTNEGATWTDISGDLPNTPVDSIFIDPDLLNTIYIATDTGVYVTSNGGTNWSSLGMGLPNVVVQDILMYHPTRTLRVVTHGRGAWDAAIPLLGLQSSASNEAFPDQTRGTTSPAQTLTLTNQLQSSAVTLTGFQISGPFTQTSNCGSTLNSAASCTVSIVFAPTAAGAAQGLLTVTSSSNTIVVALSGNGLGIPNAVLGSSGLTFPVQAIGIASQAQQITLSNTGDGSLTGVAISVAGSNGTEFSQTNNCGATLAASASCTINVVFTPTSTGSRSASLSIADNASGSPQSASLAGQGEAPFTISATSASSTVSAGNNATYQLTFTAAQSFPIGTAVSFSCSGLPGLSSCAFSPSSVPKGATSQAITVTIATTPASSPSIGLVAFGGTGLLAALSFVGVLLVPRRRDWILLLVIVIFVFQMAACSGGNHGTTTGTGTGTKSGTPAGTYQVTVTVAQPNIYQTIQTLTLNVQ